MLGLSINRCSWAKTELEILYHDCEWCIPTYDDKIIFEYLVLEMMQAGLSWSIILQKREAMREAFDNFDYIKIAQYDDSTIEKLLLNSDIIRNKLKLKAIISNARLFIDIQKEYGSFAEYIWGFVNDKAIVNSWKNLDEMPSKSEISDKISESLKKRGFKFVGSIICYSFMQAVGMVNDHVITCDYYNYKNP